MLYSLLHACGKSLISEFGKPVFGYTNQPDGRNSTMYPLFNGGVKYDMVTRTKGVYRACPSADNGVSGVSKDHNVTNAHQCGFSREASQVLKAWQAQEIFLPWSSAKDGNMKYSRGGSNSLHNVSFAIEWSPSTRQGGQCHGYWLYGSTLKSYFPTSLQLMDQTLCNIFGKSINDLAK